MSSLLTSHATIGDSTMKEPHQDLTMSSLGGPEDFTLNILDNIKRNHPTSQSDKWDEPDHSSVGGPEDFTADILDFAKPNSSDQSKSDQKCTEPHRQYSSGSRQPTVSDEEEVTEHPVESSRPSSPIVQRPHSTPSSRQCISGHGHDVPIPRPELKKRNIATSLEYENEDEGTIPLPEGGDDNTAPLPEEEHDNGHTVPFPDDAHKDKNPMPLAEYEGEDRNPGVISKDEQDGEDTEPLAHSPLPEDGPEPSLPLSLSLLDDDFTNPLAESTEVERRQMPTRVDEARLLREQLEQMKATLSQREDKISGLENKLLAKEAECEELHAAVEEREGRITALVERGNLFKEAVLVAEEESVAVAAQTSERVSALNKALASAEQNAHATETRNRSLEQEVENLTASAKAAQENLTQVRKEWEEREALWLGRSEILLAEIDRRGKAVMWAIGEKELPGVRDEKGRQAYQYRSAKPSGLDGGKHKFHIGGLATEHI